MCRSQAVFGASGLGSILRNQTDAAIVVLAWVMLVETLVIGFVPSIGRWFLGGAASALTSLTIRGGLLPKWAGAAVLDAYGLGFAAAGTRFVLRKDIA